MKKIMILALSAIITLGASAQEMRRERGPLRDGKKFEQRELRMDAKQEPNKAERLAERPQGEKKDFVGFEIKNLARELYLDSIQEVAFDKIYREFAAEREKIREEARKQEGKLSEKFAEKFGKVLNSRQVERVLRPEKPNCDKGPNPSRQPEIKRAK